MLKYWIDQSALIAQQSVRFFETSIASNSILSSRHESIFAHQFAISSFDLTKAFGFDRSLYARDLVSGAGFPNSALNDALETVRNQLAPDVVVSWSENRYLRHIFSDARIFFMELGPLPRKDLKESAHLDPFGHQNDGAIANLPASNWTTPTEQRFLDRWDHLKGSGSGQDAFALQAGSWLEQVRSADEVVLLALQPEDWITYEGLGQALDSISLIASTARRYGAGVKVLPTWHPAGPPPPDPMLDFLQTEFANVIVPPPELRVARSEDFLPFVDVVATVSSNVAVAGAIEGKRLDILNSGKFSSLGAARGRRRGDLLAFLVCRFCRPLEEWTSQQGAFANHLGVLLDDPAWLFTPVRDEELDRMEDFMLGHPCVAPQA